jgi:hypothetical protein
MKITVTVELTAAQQRVLQQHWGLPKLPTRTELTRWVRNLPETTLVDYTTQEQLERENEADA